MQVSANQLHYSEEFESGDRCVKTGTRRSASVRYFCQLNDKLRDEYATPRRRVARMTEVRTCVYEIDVVVPGLCAHTAFAVGVVNALNEFPPFPRHFPVTLSSPIASSTLPRAQTEVERASAIVDISCIPTKSVEMST